MKIIRCDVCGMELDQPKILYKLIRKGTLPKRVSHICSEQCLEIFVLRPNKSKDKQ